MIGFFLTLVLTGLVAWGATYEIFLALASFMPRTTNPIGGAYFFATMVTIIVSRSAWVWHINKRL